MKKVFSLISVLALAAVVFSCAPKSEKQTQSQEKEVIEVSINELLANAEEYEGQTVQFDAQVDHTCKHGGKKLSVFGTIEGKILKVIATETSPVFSPTLSGKTVNVIGVVQKVLEEHSGDCDGDHDHEHEHLDFTYVVECIDYSVVE